MDRIALVIGNSDYSNVGKLNNPKNDADDIASILNKLNFDVTKIMDLAKVPEFRGYLSYEEICDLYKK